MSLGDIDFSFIVKCYYKVDDDYFLSWILGGV